MHHVNPITAAADAIPADPPLADPHATAHALVERQLQMLTRLAEMGMAIAEATERWALAALDAAAAALGPPEGGLPALPGGFRGDPGLVYSRVARAVRLTLMLQTRLLKELPALGRAETLARTAQEQARRERAHRMVERAIRAEHDDADDVEQLSEDAWERLRDEDLGDGLGERPLSEVVARICQDLGLSPDWSAWAIQAVTAVSPDGHDNRPWPGTPPPLSHPAGASSPINGGAEPIIRLPRLRGRSPRSVGEGASGTRTPIGHALEPEVPHHPRQ
jgi:hypothetical protein